MKNISTRFAFIPVLAGLLLAAIFSTLAPGTAYAATAQWKDNFNLTYDGATYQSDNNDDNWYFYRVNDPDGCADIINDISWSPRGAGDKTDTPDDDDTTAKYQERKPSAVGCKDEGNKVDLDLSGHNNVKTGFAWDGEFITETNGDPFVFEYDEAIGEYIRQGDNDCKDSITTNVGSGTATIVIAVKDNTVGAQSDSQRTSNIMDPYSGHAWVSQADYADTANGCWLSETVTVNIGNTSSATDPGSGSQSGNVGTSNGGSGTNASNGDSCEESGWDLSWIACPLLLGADGALNWITNQITQMLQVPDHYIRPPNNPEALQQTWSRFRDIAYIILVPIMLVMVISTALGFEFFSAYTVKKAMPRMVLAILFITFSFYITEFLVLLTNDVGLGIHGLITGVVSPGNSDITLASLFEPGVRDSIFWGTAGILALGATAAVAGITVLLSYAFTTIIILIIGLFLLALRQMLIIGLMIFAPLAILSWIFPSNDKIWKLWWGSFSKLLLMFPLIMGLIATGKVFAYTISQIDGGADGGNGQLLFTGLKLLAFVAPFFFIPATFKFAGGIFGTISGMANDRSRGLFDRQRKYRGKKMAENFQDTRNFNRFKGNSAVSRRANSLFGYGANINKAGLNPRRMPGKLGAARSDKEILGREAMMNDDEYTWKGNDTLNRAAAESRNSRELRDALRRSGDYNGPDGTANLERDVAKVEGMRRKYGDKAFRQATFLQAVRGGTAYQGAAEPWRAAASIADGDNAVMADLVAKGKSAAMEAGRVDQGGAGFGEIMATANQFRTNPNYDMDLANRQFTSAVYDAQGANALAHSSMKGQAVDNMLPVIRERLDMAIASGNGEAVDAELANIANVYDTLSASKPELGQRFAQDIMNYEISTDSLPANLQQDFDGAINTEEGRRSQFNVLQAIDSRRSDDRFRLRRREYSQAPETRGGGRPPADPGAGPVPPVSGGPT